jgi:hypothetical protein
MTSAPPRRRTAQAGPKPARAGKPAKPATPALSEEARLIDETETNTKMVRAYGRSPKGKRLMIGMQPFCHWKTLRCRARVLPPRPTIPPKAIALTF